MQALLGKRHPVAVVTTQTVFLRDERDQADCERVLADHFGSKAPLTNFVIQPPCCGAALAVEAWAIGGEGIELERFGHDALAVNYNGIRWVYCRGVFSPDGTRGTYESAIHGFDQMRALLERAGSSFEHVVRTWLHLGGITEPEKNGSRYQELNRARTYFFNGIRFGRALPLRNGAHSVYPASTGIGIRGDGLRMSCIALETKRADVFLLPLENPCQTSAYDYDAKYSRESPKFSRGMALVAGNYVSTWISGTASIVNSESRHAGDVEAQTEQTIDNIERLIAPENFAQHDIRGAGATLRDLAKIRVYLKRPEDLVKCRSICERRFGPVPAVYVTADICRPELLVEIEGVAFSRLAP